MKNRLLLFALTILLFSCSKNSTEPPLVDLSKLEDGQVLDAEILNYLGFEIEGNTDDVQFYFHKSGRHKEIAERSDKGGGIEGPCGRRDVACCRTESHACPSNPPNQHFYATTCVSYYNLAPAGSARLIMRILLDGVWINSISVCINPTIYCEYYDPYAIISNGTVIGHWCWGPVLDECPHTITIETFNNWFTEPNCANWTLEHCGFNSKTYSYPGYPWICDDE